MKSRTVAVAVAVAGLGLSTALVSVAPAGASPDVANAHGQWAITLLTGDRVYLGQEGVARVVPGPGRTGMRFSERRYRGHDYVIPMDAVAAVTAGRLDPQLFDVTGLLAQGYDDRQRGDLPLIVQGTLPGTLPGVKTARPLAAVRGASLTVAKGNQTFWRTALRDGAQKIWLDQRLKLSQSDIASDTTNTQLGDQADEQIRAPAAWRAGYTGKGVLVAVLDSGVDATIPDLAGRIASQKNFTGEPGGDKAGHGTFVASEIASVNQTYRGVAPDAKLAIGKVCTNDGFCPESAVLDALNWAAAEQHAKVVNMSFGAPDSPGIDPLEQAVNTLTAKYGTLFVSGAGNSGGPQTLASPASADAALAVGAVYRDDKVADFSSRGPRPGDYALKPDLTAPGVGVDGAIAPGTSLDDGSGKTHGQGAGTSVSSPLAAGAAALLVQEHPAWTPAQVKAALMGSATPTPSANAFGQGAGRIDLSQAIKHEVLAKTPSLSFGLARWPHSDDSPIRRTLTYRNTSNHPVTLTLRTAATGPDGKPASRFHLSASTVTVPARGTASVHVTADTRGGGPDGEYTGDVLATSGNTTIRTPIAVVREVESYNVIIKGLDRNGQPAKHFDVAAIAYDGVPDYVATGTGYEAEGVNGTVRLRLPRAHYLLTGQVTNGDGSVDTLAAPWLTVAPRQSVTLDARKAQRIPVTVARSGAKPAVAALGVMMHIGDGYLLAMLGDDLAHTGIGQIGPGAPAGKFVAAQQAVFAAPGASNDFADSPYVYNLSWFSLDKVALSAHHVQDSELAKVETTLLAQGPAKAAGFDGAGGNPAGAPWTPALLFPIFPVSLPSTREELYTTDGVAWSHAVVQGDQPPAAEPAAAQVELWRTYQAGRKYSEVRNGGGVFGPSLPGPPLLLQDSGEQPSQSPNGLDFRLPLFSDSSATVGDSHYDAARTTMYLNGKLVCEHLSAHCTLLDDPQPGNYRVKMSVRRSLSDMSTKVSAVWRFTTDGSLGPLPVQVVRFAPKLDQANTAPGGRTFRVPVSVQRNPGAPAAQTRSLTVAVSYDDGKTWREVPVMHGMVLLKQPRQGYVSLRAKAVDSSGNSVEQTIIHAYRLR
jgi:subtilase family protein